MFINSDFWFENICAILTEKLFLTCNLSIDDDEDIVLKESETENVYYNQAQICQKDIKILDIFATIRWLEKDLDEEFLKEFKVRY